VDDNNQKENNTVDMEPVKPSINTKVRNASVDPPMIRRGTYDSQNGFGGISNSYNNAKYGYVNPISGLTNQNFNPKRSIKDPIALMTATGIISNDPTKYTKYDTRMDESTQNFNNDRNFRQTSTNAYAAAIGIPVLKKNYTSDNFNHKTKPYPMNRDSSQQMTTGRGQGKQISIKLLAFIW
jgi:hypothetical protein